MSNPDSAIIFTQQGYLLAKKNNWTIDQAMCFTSLANAYTYLGDYVKTMQFYLKALRIFEPLGDLFGMSRVNNNIGNAYITEEDYKTALTYLHAAEKQLNAYASTHTLLPNHKHLRAIINENIGECYLDLHQMNLAEHYLNLSYDDAKKLDFIDMMGGIQHDLGELESARGDKDKALRFFREAVINDKLAGNGEDLNDTYLSIAKTYHKNKQQDSAEYYAQKALETASEGKYEQDVLNAGKVLYAYYDEDKNIPEAYKYFKITTAAKDSLYSQDKVKQLLSLDFDERQRKQDIAAAQEQYKNKVRIYLLIGGLVVLLLLVILFWRNSNQRQKANKLLHNQNEEIETQKKSVEQTLSELKATQTQLVQREKMASLGELTAGIAHEIQNPLNFVNNFSEVNQEMIDELEGVLTSGNISEALSIATGIKQNEQKISHHGKRADAIVKSMLQHSKTGRGAKEPIDINALADEYLRLAYHGMRSKDNNFKAELVTNLDADLPQINVIPQDIGRVLLNLFNNAFYAVNQKQKVAGENYKPEALVITSSENGQVIIKIKDNGTGIPDAIKDKIMQPFFTTKPTGEGTGLGLSLTYDMVVKGHGGSIQVESVEGKGSEFIVSLPV
jgi:signal transduction histidine kinase